MIKNLLMTISLGAFVIGMTCSVGCGGPGDTVKGNENAKFAEKSGETDPLGRDIPKGLGHLD